MIQLKSFTRSRYVDEGINYFFCFSTNSLLHFSVWCFGNVNYRLLGNFSSLIKQRKNEILNKYAARENANDGNVNVKMCACNISKIENK